MKKHPTIELLESLNSGLIYVLESATILAVLYLVYHFFLRKERSFYYNRFFLLTALLFAVTLPLLNFNYDPAKLPAVLNSIHQVGNEVGSEPIIEADKVYSYTITAQSERPFILWWEALLITYLAGVVIALFKFLLRIRGLKEVIWYKRHNTRFKKGYFLVKTEGSLPTFSFINYLFWDDSLILSEEEKNQILAHEEVHIKERHSLDILWVEALKILFWFNPFFYLYKSLLEESHEYTADFQASRNISTQVYSKLLVRTVFNKMGFVYGSHFSRKNQTLKRVKMLANLKQVNILKLLIPIPVIVLLIFIFSFNAKIGVQVEVENYKIENAQVSSETSLPVPLEGIQAWKNQLSNDIEYPTKAILSNVEGEVLVSFVVNKQGTIEGLSFDKKLGAGTELAIYNALQKSGKWSPGQQNGVSIDTRISLPIQFRLG